MNNKIGIFDSGIGGLTTLKEIKKLLPHENYLYYADSQNNPYGEKTNKELLNIVTNITDFLIKKNVKIIVIACNTATTRCINKLRKIYPFVTFIGTEPAIKVACNKNFKNTLVLATPSTIKSERTNELVKKYKNDNQTITLLPCKGLADAIEKQDQTKIEKLLHQLLDKYQNKSIDSIVLGCTHYPHIKNNIQKMFPQAKIIDGNKGVAKQVKKQLKLNNLLNNSPKEGNIELYITKK